MPDKREVGVHPLRTSIVTQSMTFFVIIFALPMAIFFHLLSQASACLLYTSDVYKRQPSAMPGRTWM